MKRVSNKRRTILVVAASVFAALQIAFDVWFVLYRSDTDETLRAQRTINNSVVRSLSNPSGNIAPPEGCGGRPVVWQEPKGLGC